MARAALVATCLAIARGLSIPRDLADNLGAKCLNGTPPTFSVTLNASSSKWVVFMEGGGWCYGPDEQSTLQACFTMGFLWPPRKLEADADIGGIMSQDPSVNPDFASWNKVLLHSCDHSSFGGSRMEPVLMTANGGRFVEMWFRGRNNFNALIEHLLTGFGMSSASEVILTGGSAGGLAVFYNLDHLATLLPRGARLVGFPDAGFFLDAPNVNGHHVYRSYFQAADLVWNVTGSGGTNARCLAANVGQEWKCLMAPYLASFVKTPFFVMNSAFDWWQLNNILNAACVPLPLSAPCSAEQNGSLRDYKDRFARDIGSVLGEGRANGLYISSCYVHQQNVDYCSDQSLPNCVGWSPHSPGSRRWGYSTSVPSESGIRLTPQEAFGDYYFRRSSGVSIDPLHMPDNPSCRYLGNPALQVAAANAPASEGDAASAPSPPQPLGLGDSGCWGEGFTADICCDPRAGPGGLSECWDVIFTYERCCALASETPAEAPFATPTNLGTAPHGPEQEDLSGFQQALTHSESLGGPSSTSHSDLEAAGSAAEPQMVSGVREDVPHGALGSEETLERMHGALDGSRGVPSKENSVPASAGGHRAGLGGAREIDGGEQQAPDDRRETQQSSEEVLGIPGASPPGTTVEASTCWSGDFSALLCCHPRFGPAGNARCWDGIFYTYQRCCHPRSGDELQKEVPMAQRSQGSPGPVTGSDTASICYASGICCGPGVGPQGGRFIFCDDSRKCSAARSNHAGVLSLALAIICLLAAAWARRTTPVCSDANRNPVDRSPMLDSARFMFVTLVVASHHSSFLIGGGDPIELCTRFRVRGLCFISGYLRRRTPNLKSMRQLVFRLLAPILFYSLLIEPLFLPLFGGVLPISVEAYARHALHNLFLYRVDGPAWYIFALVLWEVWGYMLMPLGPKARVSVAFAFAAVGGYIGIAAFKMNMAMACFPTFVLGQVFPLELLERWSVRPAWRATGLGLLSVLLGTQLSSVGAAFMRDMPPYAWNDFVTSNFTMQFCRQEEVAIFWLRGTFVNLSDVFLTVLFLLVCCPRSNCVLSELGKRTIYPYLLHMPYVDSAMWQGWRYLETSVQIELPALVNRFLPPVILSVFLASAPVHKLFGPLLEPRWLERHIAASE